MRPIPSIGSFEKLVEGNCVCSFLVTFPSIVLEDDVYYNRKVAMGANPMRRGTPESQDEWVFSGIQNA